ncbi:MAG: adenylate/guanylate cyclase domain-containing protein, partial [Chloroflexi bacterium]|nr:adenylate/guanylate cyclase domain-containing protein [Chloroflexota bacterium]
MAKTSLPTGTVTFLFSDIEGSTRLARELGGRWSETLAEHRRLLRDAFMAHGGVEVGTEGDSFFVAFPTPIGALEAAVAGQRALASHAWSGDTPLRVRMGLHTTGDAEVVDDSYAGLDVHRAARIMSAGHGGQILVSSSTRGLVQDVLPEDIVLYDLGEHRLKDLPDRQSLTQVCVTGLPRDFPPLRTLDAARTNLPAQATTFIGREEEVARVRELLKANRLVTLTGPGGTGKTRLSLKVAGEELTGFLDGVYWVPLAAIREPELVLPAIGKSIGLTDAGPQPIQRLADHLAGKRLLVILDNVEQVIGAVPDLAELLERTNELRLLATSRSALRIYGEQEYAVPPLPMPDPRQTPSDRTILRFAAPALFVERARR